MQLRFQIGDNIIAIGILNSISSSIESIVGTGDMYDDISSFKCLDGEYTWEDLTHLCVGDIVIPNGITSIASNFLYTSDYIQNIKNVYIGKDVKTIGVNAFRSISYMGPINIEIGTPSLLESIGDYAFSGCVRLQSIDFHKNNITLGEGCFRDCQSIVTLNLGTKLGVIKAMTFNGCTKLIEFNDKNTIEDLEISSNSGANGIFLNCNSIEYFTFKNECSFGNNDIGFNKFFKLELNSGTNCNEDGLQITTIYTNNPKAIVHDWINLDNRYPIFIQGVEFIYVAHKGKWIKISGYNSDIGNIPVSHEKVYLWIRMLEQGDSDGTPIFVAHKGKWHQIGY